VAGFEPATSRDKRDDTLTWLKIFFTQNTKKDEEKVRLTTPPSTGALPSDATLRHKTSKEQKERAPSTFQFSNFGHKRKRFL